MSLKDLYNELMKTSTTFNTLQLEQTTQLKICEILSKQFIQGNSDVFEMAIKW
jgi:hypothetical protein